MAESAQELFEHQLKDIYDAEQKLLKALSKMAKDVEDEELSEAFKQHRGATEGHVERLERVFESIERRPQRQPCAGIDGLVKEYTKFVRDENPEGALLDAFAVNAALKVEYYEIVAYKGLIDLASRLELQQAVELLQENLREEEETASKLEQMSKPLGDVLATASRGSE